MKVLISFSDKTETVVQENNFYKKTHVTPEITGVVVEDKDEAEIRESVFTAIKASKMGTHLAARMRTGALKVYMKGGKK